MSNDMQTDESRPWFGRNAPFYPFVISFSAAIHGLHELLSRALVDLGAATGSEDQIKEAIEKIGGAKSVARFVNASVTPLILRDLKLESSAGPNIGLDVSEIGPELYRERDYLLPYMIDAPIRSLLAGCYAATEDTERIPTHPVWEFFRHCRNAAAHGGRFHFKYNKRFKQQEPVHPAIWRGLAITTSMEGQPLVVPMNKEEPFLKPGDVLWLLADLESTFNPKTD